jgi:hypothetical protein
VHRPCLTDGLVPPIGVLKQFTHRTNPRCPLVERQCRGELTRSHQTLVQGIVGRDQALQRVPSPRG